MEVKLRKTISARAIEKFGRAHQVAKSIEELGELSTELARWTQLEYRGECSIASLEVIEELADVLIMCDQLRLIFGAYHVDEMKAKKLERLEKLIEGSAGDE